MRVLISGVCGFVGSSIAKFLAVNNSSIKVIGFDNFSRAGSWLSLASLRHMGVQFVHADVRVPSDLSVLSEVDWVIDAAAAPSVVSGMGGEITSRKLMDQNLFGTVNLLERCRDWGAGFILLSSSRVYSIKAVQDIVLETAQDSFILKPEGLPAPGGGLSVFGISEEFTTIPPVSLYGSSKLASECIALEYGFAFNYPVIINRCGVLAGAGQFGRADQGVFSYWIHSWRDGLPLSYIGFGGQGLQVRDILHPRDLAALISVQISKSTGPLESCVFNVSGGIESAMSLKQLSKWCEARWGLREVGSVVANRVFDVPWVVLDSRFSRNTWGWEPMMSKYAILEELACFADENQGWLEATK